MGRPNKVIEVTKAIVGYYMSRDGEVTCRHCEGEISLGEQAFSKHFGRKGRNSRKVLYCINCADVLCLI